MSKNPLEPLLSLSSSDEAVIWPGRNRCSQCGQPFSAPVCGFAHATLQVSEDQRRALAERIWRKILTTYRVLDHEGCETGPDDPGDCGLFTLIYDELDREES